MNFVIYFLLTCGLPIWLGFFFLKGCDRLFRKSPSSTKIFNGLQYSFQVWQGFINLSKSFSYKDPLFILATTRKEDFRINSTFKSDFLLYGLFKSRVSINKGITRHES